MELIGGLIVAIMVLSVVGLILAAPIMAIIAMNRVRRLEDRLGVLERRSVVAPVAAPLIATAAAAMAPSPPSPSEVVARAAEPAPLPAAEAAVPPRPVRPPAPPVAAEPRVAADPPVAAEPPAASEPPRRREPPASPQPPRRRVDWEQWVGVRGAAVVGGAVLAFASLLFFQYSIERGLISPTMRVVLGVVVGLGAIFWSQWLHGRRQVATANALAGAGVVILYGAVWAARSLYQLIGATPAAVLMILITATCGLLAVRRDSLVVAILGLVGGFATPLLVSAGLDQPVTLFTYVLLLDAGLLWLARTRGWAVLAVLSLVGTGVHQALWIFNRLTPESALLALGVLAVFAVAFLALGRDEQREGLIWRLTRAGGVAIPFAFAVHFAGGAALGDHLAPVGALLILLTACGAWLAHRQDHGLLAHLVAGFDLGIVAVWLVNHRPDVAQTWEAVAVCAVLGIVLQVATELAGNVSWRSLAGATVIANTGLLGLLALAALAAGSSHSLWPWLAGFTVLAAVLVRHGANPGPAPVQLLAGLGGPLALAMFSFPHAAREWFPVVGLYLAILVAAALAFQAVALLARVGETRRWADHAAAAAAIVLILGTLVFVDTPSFPSHACLAVATVLGLLAALAATRRGAGSLYCVAVLAVAAHHSLWTFATAFNHEATIDLAFFALQLASVALFTFWPALATRAFAASRWAWYGAAAAGPLWFLSLRTQWLELFGDEVIAVLPIALAVLSLAAAALARRSSPATFAVRASALAWFLAVTLCFVSLAIPLQLEREWVTIGWALNGLAVLALWRHLDHPGLKLLGVALLGAATIRLVANPSVLAYHARGAYRVLNWLLYTYLVPAAALIGATMILRRLEVERLRPAEQRLQGRRAVATAACGLAAVVVVFAWINLTIAEVFSTTNQLTLTFDRLPARDLSTSIAWAGYALVLLVLGIRLDLSALRWLSLGLMMGAIAKVFLHDLGELKDLYRVASLLGLAVSLIAVSLVYQRFVLRREPPEESS